MRSHEVLCALGFLSAALWAGMPEIQHLTTMEVAHRSTRIVLAKCLASEVKKLFGGNIFTFSDFEVLQRVKGVPGRERFTIRLIGGRMGNVEVSSPLDFRFAPGEKYVLFLGRDNAEGYPIYRTAVCISRPFGTQE